MKKLFLSLFLRDKLIGQLAAAAASAAAAYLVTLLSGLPDFAQPIVSAILNLPEGTAITPATLTVVLAPLFLAVINTVIQEFLIKDNNKVLVDLKATGLYEGKIDGWVGPNAKAAVEKLIDSSADGIQNFR